MAELQTVVDGLAFICTSESGPPSVTTVTRPGRIQTRGVDVPGVGLP